MYRLYIQYSLSSILYRIIINQPVKRSSWVKRENETSFLSLPFLLRNDIFFAPALIYTVKHLSFEISPKTIFNWKARKIVLDFKNFCAALFQPMSVR